VESLSRFPQRENPRDSWPAWTDAHVWVPTEPEPDPVATPRGAERVTLGRMEDFYAGYPAGAFSDAVYVEHRVGDEVLAFRAFLTHAEARRYAASLWGEGGCDPDTESTLDDTLTPLQYWLLTADPDPEQSPSGHWRRPGEDEPRDINPLG
jgi:hypothetical protein